MSRLADRVTKLERSRGSGYVAYRFLKFNPDFRAEDYERLRERTLDEMVAAGEINERQRNRVFFARWLAADETGR
jgi:hypothetical protein